MLLRHLRFMAWVTERELQSDKMPDTMMQYLADWSICLSATISCRCLVRHFRDVDLQLTGPCSQHLLVPSMISTHRGGYKTTMNSVVAPSTKDRHPFVIKMPQPQSVDSKSELFSEDTWFQGMLLTFVAYGSTVTLCIQCFFTFASILTRPKILSQLPLLAFVVAIFALSTIFIGGADTIVLALLPSSTIRTWRKGQNIMNKPTGPYIST